METSLHRQLKQLYAADDQVEVRCGRFRIDAVLADGMLVEIQHGSLAAIRDKVRRLLDSHRVLVVKPIVRRKRLVKRGRRDGPVVAQRLSPKRGRDIDLFDDLVYFTQVFPHPNLTIESAMVDVEEWRHPGHGKRRRWRASDHEVEDRKLVAVESQRQFCSPADLLSLLPGAAELSEPFGSAELAAAAKVARHAAQRICYACRKMGALQEVGRQRNARLYRRAA